MVKQARRRRHTQARKKKSSSSRTHETFILTTIALLALAGAATQSIPTQLPAHNDLLSEIPTVIFFLIATTLFLIIMYVSFVIIRVTRAYVIKYQQAVAQKQRVENEFLIQSSFARYQSMDGYDFEKYVAQVYTKMGYKAQVTQGRNDKGIDIIMNNGTQNIAVQTKRYSSKYNVGRPDVQRFMGSIFKYDQGIFLTTSNFTESARAYAADHPKLQLINGAQFAQMVKAVMNRAN